MSALQNACAALLLAASPMWSALAAPAVGGAEQHAQTAAAPPSLALGGLIGPAEVAGSIFVYAKAPAATVSVSYFIDDKLRTTETVSPFWMGGAVNGAAAGFSLTDDAPGVHKLRAVATLAAGATVSSDTIALTVDATLNAQLSAALSVYANQPGAQRKSLAEMLAATTTPGAVLTAAELAARNTILRMYMNWGIDPSLDGGLDQSTMLAALEPKTWAPPSPPAPGTPLSLLFSPDAPFYQAIPLRWPKTALPAGYFHMVQLNTAHQGDGIGFGEAVAGANDPILPVTSKWYDNLATLRTFPFRMPGTWTASLPGQASGDMHMLFIDPLGGSFVSAYKTSLDPFTGGPDALYAAGPTALASLGDHGGSVASGIAELPAMLQPGEATDAVHPIRHALSGSISRVWAARVYPATAWDTNVKTSMNTCTHAGFTNTGLVPYGGVLQLDPSLDLTRLHLTLPALRILQAIQTYGFYAMDFGCADLDIYTAISESELEPYGGLWGYNRLGPGVQNEIAAVLLGSRLSVVAPLMKKQ